MPLNRFGKKIKTTAQITQEHYETMERRKQRHMATEERQKKSMEYMDKMYPDRITNWEKEKQERQNEIDRFKHNLTIMVNELKAMILKDAYENGVQYALKQQSSGIKALITENKKFMEINKDSTFSFVSDLFVQLSKEVPEFTCYAPTNMFAGPINNVKGKTTGDTYLHLNKLTTAELIILDKKLKAQNPEIFNNDYFKKTYLRYFPSHIAEMTDENDIIAALKNDPSAYKNIAPSVKTAFHNNSRLYTFLTHVPEVVEHMSVKEIETFASHDNVRYLSALGIALVKHPIALEKLDSLFFVRNNPKYIFSRTKAIEIKNLEDVMDKFNGLKEFYTQKQKFAEVANKRAAEKDLQADIVDPLNQ